jgi:hypothetical protein
MRPITRITSYIIGTVLLSVLGSSVVSAHPAGLLFPVIGNTNYSDTFLAYRAGQPSDKHHAIDIFGAKHGKIVSPIDGTVRYVGYPQDSWGWYVILVDDDGFEYHFMHINNDTPGTDNGAGGPMNAYAPDLKGEYNVGEQNATRVVKGQTIAYLGDSGNAENTPAHLHFEIIKPEYTDMEYRSIPLEGFVNPFTFLNAAAHLSQPNDYPALPGEILPYGPKAAMDVNVAKGNFDADPELETVTAAGYGGGPHIKVYDANGTFTGKEFMAYNPYFAGGVDVAAGDVDGDGVDEIITGAGYGGGPHVRVFSSNGVELAGFYAYDYRFAGGIRVAAGDVNGDGKAEIVTGIYSSGGPHVRVFSYQGQVLSEFMAYDPYFTGGVDVAVGDVLNTGATKKEIITSAGPGGGPHVRVFNESGVGLSSFYAYATNYTGGVHVSAGKVNSSSPMEEIVTSPWQHGGSDIRVIKANGTVLTAKLYLEPWWDGSYDVAAGNDNVTIGTGIGRRSTVRTLFP